MSWIPRPPRIGDIVRRRADLSTYLVHLTKNTQGATARQNLVSILTARSIDARSPMGLAKAKFDQAGIAPPASMNCVCFTEAPLDQIAWLCGRIAGRQNDYEFQPYGVAVTKKYARKVGANPVWYLDQTPGTGVPGGKNWLSSDLNSEIASAIASGTYWGSWLERATPFIETMGQGKEFWWEREWRYTGNLKSGTIVSPALGVFPLPATPIVICPDNPADRAALATLPAPQRDWPVIDAMWSLEQIIANLAGIPSSDIGPI